MSKIAIIKQRILEYLENKGISKYECYQKTGMTNGVLSKTEGLSEENLLRFVSYYDDVNLEWLLKGQGEMTGRIAKSLLKDEQTTVATAIKSTGEKGIPLIPLEAVAGVMSDNNMQVLKHECEYYRVPLFKNADFLMQVTGDSMQPKYYSGDIVACRKVFIGTFFQWNRVYVIDTNQGVVIKRVHEGKDDKHIRLVSDNTDYKPFEISLEDVCSIAIVVGVVRAE